MRDFQVYRAGGGGTQALLHGARRAGICLPCKLAGVLWVVFLLSLLRLPAFSGAGQPVPVLAGSVLRPAAPSLAPPISRTSGLRQPGAAAFAGFEDYPLRFERLSIEQGLSQSSVNCILQDARGFLWFGTQDGLNRYDGRAFVVYQPQPGDPASLSNQFILSLAEDADGRLWIVTAGGGINRFDRRSGRFEVIQLPGLQDEPASQVFRDSRGSIWIGAHSGLFRYDSQSGRFTQFQHQDLDATSLSSSHITAIFEDREGLLWVGTADAGLNRFDPTANEAVHFRSQAGKPDTLTSDQVAVIAQDQAGNLWVGTPEGLNRLEPGSEKVTRYRHDPQDPGSLGSDAVSALLVDSQGRLWIGAGGSGLDLWHPGSGRFIHFSHIQDEPNSLGNNFVLSIYEDRSGVLWIGTHGAGLSKMRMLDSPMIHFRKGPQGSTNIFDGLSDDLVWSIYQDHLGLVWVGTNDGLNVYDRSQERWTVYRHDPGDPGSLSGNVVFAINEDPAGNLWVGTMDQGLNRFDRQSGKFTHYHHPSGQVGSPAADSVASIFFDQDGLLWASVIGGGLDYLDPESGALQPYTVSGEWIDLFQESFFWTIFQDHSGSFWLGSNGEGLVHIDRATGKITRYLPQPDHPEGLGSRTVMSILQDADGLLWLGTDGGGLVRFDPVQESFKSYRGRQGLPDDVVYGVLQDDQGFLWLSTNRGLSRFDPRSEQFTNFDVSDGLQSMEFNSGAYYKNREGEMLFGGIHGLNIFSPRQVGQPNPYLPPIVMTSLTQTGRPLQPGGALEDLQQITLTWPENYFEFEFAGLSYIRPEENQYAYRLENFDREWNQAGGRSFGSYTNLPGGDYVLHLRGSNNDGVWNEQGASIRVKVVPPVWQTWWFGGTLFLLAAAAAVGGYWLRLRSVHNRNRDLERAIQVRTAELQAENEQRLQAEEALRLSELEKAVISERSRLARELHDAVTQTLFSASLIAEALPAAWEDDPREGKELLKELRLLSRGALAEMRTILVELRPAALADSRLEDLIRQLAEAASGKEGFPVTLSVDGRSTLPAEVHIAFYRIAQETLHNVLKHARAGAVTVHLRYLNNGAGLGTEEACDGVVLTIRDNGRGFDPERVPPDHLGLKIMHERAESISATLTVESQPGSGTQVTALWEKESYQ